MQIRLAHLYPDLMNIYGDRGNVLALVNRARQRGIDIVVSEVSIGQALDPAAHDLYFFGGGQDREQIPVAADLVASKAEALREAIEGGAALLSVCGGFQLLARYYQPFDADRLPGIGLFDAWTVASHQRMIGNVVIELAAASPLAQDGRPRTVVGFENHSGKTYLGPGGQPLGRVVVGYGNNGEDRTEGAVYRQAIGCYLHGSLLPKNPHLADFLLAQALAHRYGAVELPPLDDTLEWRAHQAAVQRARQTR